MNEKVIKLILQLFISLSYLNKGIQMPLSKLFVENYLKHKLGNATIKRYMILWEKYTSKIGNEVVNNTNPEFIKNKILFICNSLNRFLDKMQRMITLVEIINFAKNFHSVQFDNTLKNISAYFHIDESDFNDLKHFIYDELHKVKNNNKLLYVTNDAGFKISGIKVHNKKNISGSFVVIYLKSTNSFFFKYTGSDSYYLSGKALFSNEVYLLEDSAFITSSITHEPILYYSEIVAIYNYSQSESYFTFNIKAIEYTYPKSQYGLKKFSFEGHCGELIAVMGGSGTGKTTLLSLLNGSLKPDKGEILVNNYDIIKDKNQLEGLIGYIPQDDLLVEELTVFQNLYYNAKLSFGHLTHDEIKERVQKILVDLELWDFKDLRVGSPLKKYISGGQRKRLNIALELIRKPSVIFVDEPTSGLSSSDSLRVIDLLKSEAGRGSFILVNIHQPSPHIFRKFDKLIVLDKGGYVIYCGNPLEAICYFRKHTLEINDNENTFFDFNSIMPDQLFEFIEQKKINDIGELTEERKITPEIWYSKFWNINNHNSKEYINKPIDKEFPKPITKRPNRLKQFLVFFSRNITSKASDLQYIIIGMLVTPILAITLSIITRYMRKGIDSEYEYVFYYNENIPAFLLMSVIVALFVGLIISAEEIFRDRKIQQREKFLNLSWCSYVNSKVLFLIMLSSFQALVYSIIGVIILQIPNFIFPLWSIMFSLFSFGNLMGLNISASLKSAVSIYIIIPIILVPQILLCGVIVQFDKLHPLITSDKVVPVVGDIMVSRWAYEGLMVEQFVNNDYNIHFFDIDKVISDYSFALNFLIPELIEASKKIKENIGQDNIINTEVDLIINELGKLIEVYGLTKPDFFHKLKNNKIDKDAISDAEQYLNELKKDFSRALRKMLLKKDSKIYELTTTLGQAKFDSLMFNNTNKKVSDFVLNNNSLYKEVKHNDKIVRLYEPIYHSPDSKIGRAHLFAPFKKIWHYNFQTFWFNLLVIWFFNATLYLIILTNSINKFLEAYRKLTKKN